MKISLHILLFLFFTGNLYGQSKDTASYKISRGQKSRDDAHTAKLRQLNQLPQNDSTFACRVYNQGKDSGKILTLILTANSPLKLRGLSDSATIITSFHLSLASRGGVFIDKYSKNGYFTTDMISAIKMLGYGGTIMLQSIVSKTPDGKTKLLKAVYSKVL
jgi:hypothetical protein